MIVYAAVMVGIVGVIVPVLVLALVLMLMSVLALFLVLVWHGPAERFLRGIENVSQKE